MRKHCLQPVIKAEMYHLLTCQPPSLGDCSSLTDQGLSELVNIKGGHLKELYLPGVRTIVGQGLAASNLPLKRLQVLDLSGCDEVTNQWMWDTQCLGTESLNLGFIRHQDHWRGIFCSKSKNGKSAGSNPGSLPNADEPRTLRDDQLHGIKSQEVISYLTELEVSNNHAIGGIKALKVDNLFLAFPNYYRKGSKEYSIQRS